MIRVQLTALALGFSITGSVLASANDTVPESITSLTFGDDQTLFVGDSNGARIFAYQLPATAAAPDSSAFNVLGFGERVAARYGASESDVLFHDIAVHPRSGEAFVALSVIRSGSAEPAIIQIGSSKTVPHASLNPQRTRRLQR